METKSDVALESSSENAVGTADSFLHQSKDRAPPFLPDVDFFLGLHFDFIVVPNDKLNKEVCKKRFS
jgi:hypothetical protein